MMRNFQNIIKIFNNRNKCPILGTLLSSSGIYMIEFPVTEHFINMNFLCVNI